MYYDTYVARGRDVAEIANLAQSYGYDNPGPIVAFPSNQAQFPRNATPAAVLAGVRILVPWHPNLLRKIIATQEHIAGEVAERARELIEEQHTTKEKLEQFLILVDSACMLINVGKGIGDLAAHGLKH